ncbi:suppressor of fused domain protein [Anaerotignum sp. MB30-C6]|uniref:suppressor of fused domain protein n=1 Tax=Anaerotignum sp. MB30-C6 TaxID=3070814 RepID=UPI0027DAED0E|nr:suppressor of fused domain protein [Anaerotignum sp. MB30-C6]WMI82054.1 suppressor of fused domain protein [Anaerotignum sp. MB30-C6]
MMENQKKVSEYHYKEPKVTGKKRPVHTTPYDKEIDKHMKTLFPDRKERVFYEQSSEFLQIDIHLLEAPTKQDFHVLYTVGMSALPMTLPPDLLPQYKDLELGELMLLLPAEWSLPLPEDGKVDNRLWWPVNLLKYLSRFPHEYKTWLGWGHTIPNSEDYVPYDESTKLCGVMLGALQEEISLLRSKDGTQINFYSLIPLYKEEIEGKQKEGTEGLLTKLSSLNGFGMIIFPDRPNVYHNEK